MKVPDFLYYWLPFLLHRTFILKILSQERFLKTVLAVWIAVSAGAFWFSFQLEWDQHDFLQRMFSRYRTVSHNNLVVGIDSITLKAIPHSYPWPQETCKELLNRLLEGYPNSVFFLLPEFRSDGTAEAWETLLQAYATDSRVVFLQRTRQESDFSFFPLIGSGTLEKSGQPANFRFFFDFDRKVRFFQMKTEGLPTINPATKESSVHSSLLLFYRNLGGIPHISLQETLGKDFPLALLQGKNLFVGPTAFVLHDFHSTALGNLPAVEILAHVFESYRQNTFATSRFSFPGRFLAFLLGMALPLLLLPPGFVSQMGFGIFCVLCTIFVEFHWAWKGIFFPSVSFLAGFLVGFGFNFFIDKVQQLFQRGLRASQLRSFAKVQSLIAPSHSVALGDRIVVSGGIIPPEVDTGGFWEFFPAAEAVSFTAGIFPDKGFASGMVTTMWRSCFLGQMAEGSHETLPEILRSSLVQISDYSNVSDRSPLIVGKVEGDTLSFVTNGPQRITILRDRDSVIHTESFGEKDVQVIQIKPGEILGIFCVGSDCEMSLSSQSKVVEELFRVSEITPKNISNLCTKHPGPSEIPGEATFIRIHFKRN